MIAQDFMDQINQDHIQNSTMNDRDKQSNHTK